MLKFILFTLLLCVQAFGHDYEVSPVMPGSRHEHEVQENSAFIRSRKTLQPLASGTFEIPVLFLYTEDTFRLNLQDSSEISNQRIQEKINQVTSLAQEVFHNSVIPFKIVPLAVKVFPGNFKNIDNVDLLKDFNNILLDLLADDDIVATNCTDSRDINLVI